MKSIEYSLVLSKRKTIAIIVKPDQTVEVRAPKRVLKRDVESFLKQKETWVLAKLIEFSSRPQPHVEVYEEGARHYFLGESHCIVDSMTVKSGQMNLLLNEPVDIITLRGLKSASVEQVRGKLDRWYRKEALSLFTERHDLWRERMGYFDLPESTVGVRKMKRRWGSCTTKGKITLSTTLAKYPLSCVDAVVVHELCHLMEFSHNKRFYQLMTQAYPEWRVGDKLLQTLSWQY